MDFGVVTKKGENEKIKRLKLRKRKVEVKKRIVKIKVTKSKEESPLINLE